MLGNRYSQHSFAQIPAVNHPRSQFDRSFPHKSTFEFDYLVPLFVDEILPGDTANVDVQSFARLTTQVRPVMDNMYIDWFFFFVPNRLVWENWERFNGAQDNPADSTDYTVPTVTLTADDPTFSNIYAYMGIPAFNGVVANALPLRAYNLIWNEWFRDQNLQNSITVDIDDGPDTYGNYTLRKRNKKHDYFTSALPWPQKGAAVALPLGTSAPVYGEAQSPGSVRGHIWQTTRSTAPFPALSGPITAAATTGALSGTGLQDSGVSGVYLGLGTPAQYTSSGSAEYKPPYVDLTEATGATINALREAMQVQSLLELDARGGTRYTEILLNHFGVISPDFRLQRPEYLGGGTTYFNSHPVPQTAPTAGSDAQGQLASYATASSVGKSVGFTKSFVEHGWVIGMACARSEVTYQQGLNRMFSRETRFDYYWPKLAQLGEQAILNKEIWWGGGNEDEVWGYQERYAEYRYRPGMITGLLNSAATNSLDVWHLAQDYVARPLLNSSFIQQNTPIDRTLAVTNEPAIIIDIFYQYKHARAMPTYSVPVTLGRF